MNLNFWKKKEAAPAAQPGSVAVQQISPQRFSVTVSGVIAPAHVAAVQQKIMSVAGQGGGKARGIIRAEGFQGFARGFDGGTAEIERMWAIDEVVERIAVVADRKQHENLNIFMAGWTRKSQLEFFAPQELARAQAWLES